MRDLNEVSLCRLHINPNVGGAHRAKVGHFEPDFIHRMYIYIFIIVIEKQ